MHFLCAIALPIGWLTSGQTPASVLEASAAFLVAASRWLLLVIQQLLGQQLLVRQLAFLHTVPSPFVLPFQLS